ncbi:MAG: phosphoribosylformylglycinamidine synthase subunit PurS, partial [Candidatus Poribacteria bacterium]|nr:phosphoribosylformylglycinamidine synthase subunit PurS [Candidatus Poribacteria bacterium]
MSAFTIEVSTKPSLPDADGRRIEHEITDLGIDASIAARVSQMYWLEGSLSDHDADTIATRLLTDAISQDAVVGERSGARQVGVGKGWIAEIRLKPGVTDAIGETVVKGARDLGIGALERANTGSRVTLVGDVSEDLARAICERLLVNDVVQTYTLQR